MIKQLLDTFKVLYDRHGDTLLYADYKLKPGLYMLIRRNGSIDTLTIQKDTVPSMDTLYQDFAYYSTQSRALDINNTIDKKFQSNSYLSMIITGKYFTDSYWEQLKQKEPNKNHTERLESAFDNYYECLSTKISTTKKRAYQIYGQVTEETVRPYKEKVAEILKDLAKTQWNKLPDEINIFFEADSHTWQREILRYLAYALPLGEKYVTEKNGTLYSVPSYLYIGASSKKFIMGNTLGFNPYELSVDDLALYSKLMLYLQGLLKLNKRYVYVTMDSIQAFTAKESVKFEKDHQAVNSFNGWFYVLGADYGKPIIIDYQPVSHFTPIFKNCTIPLVFGKDTKDTKSVYPRTVISTYDMLQILNTTFFGNKLAYNLFTPTGEIDSKVIATTPYLLELRSAIARWLYLGNSQSVIPLFKRYLLDFIPTYAQKGATKTSLQQMWTVINGLDAYLNLNLGNFDTKGETSMSKMYFTYLENVLDTYRTQRKEKSDDVQILTITDDAMYFVLAGQLMQYLIKQSVSENIGMLQGIALGYTSVQQIQSELPRLYSNYAYAIQSKFPGYLLSSLLNYTPQSKKIDKAAYTFGYLADCILYKSLKERTED